jgi:drug/metabolite transporter (DMT)-like permease
MYEGQSRARAGLAFAVVSAGTFGLAGPLGKSLLDTGWSPLGVVLARISGAAVLLVLPLVGILARGWRPRRAHVRTTLLYGAAAVAGAQVCFFNAVEHLPVGVALLLEYLAPVLLLGWTWLRTGLSPTRTTVAGAALALGGLTLVLDVLGDARVDPVGVIWGLGAAVCLSVFYQTSASDDAPPPVVLAACGMLVATVVVLLVGAAGILPLDVGAAAASVGGVAMPWWAPVLLLAGVSTVVAYSTGIVAIGILGTRVASFVGLTEVLFAVLAAWWLVAERPSLTQAVGGLLVLAGIAVVRAGQRVLSTDRPDPVPVG